MPTHNLQSTHVTALLALWAWAPSALATLPLDGVLTATRDCLATTSINHADLDGMVQLESGHTYRLLDRNREDASHYQVLIEGAKPAERWVDVGCGNLITGRAGGPQATVEVPVQAYIGVTAESQANVDPPAKSKPGAFVLALSWQPAFCKINRRKAECRNQDAARLDPSRFSLQGLWPQPRDNGYCGVDTRARMLDRMGDWFALTSPDLSPETRKRLDPLMPGTRSGLHRHEWLAHGTCYGTGADIYFRDAMMLVEQVNASPIRSLFASNLGKHLSSNEIHAAFEAIFGRGAGDRVRVVYTG